MKDSGSYTIGFSGQYIEIGYNNAAARSFAEFLFCDLQTTSELPSRTRYDILIVGRQPKVSLWQGDKMLYFGESKYKLAYTLINEVIYECIVDSRNVHALHAGALSCRDCGIIVPGKSGSGKSTFVAWLISQGLNYLSDELVFISEKGIIQPFTRPVSLKSPDFSLLSSFVNLDRDKVIYDQKGIMIPHRLINPDFQPDNPPLTHIIFPRFQHGARTEVTKLSSARSCFKLMECHVNARNIKGHGFSNLAELTRQVESYQLTYGSFDNLFNSLEPILPCL